MPSFTIQLKPKGMEVIHGTATVETSGAEDSTTESHKFFVHEGLPDTFDVNIGPKQRLVIALENKEELHYDAAQGTVTRIPIIEAPDGVPIGGGGGDEEAGARHASPPPKKPEAKTHSAPSHR